MSGRDLITFEEGLIVESNSRNFPLIWKVTNSFSGGGLNLLWKERLNSPPQVPFDTSDRTPAGASFFFFFFYHAQIKTMYTRRIRPLSLYVYIIPCEVRQLCTPFFIYTFETSLRVYSYGRSKRARLVSVVEKKRIVRFYLCRGGENVP